VVTRGFAIWRRFGDVHLRLVKRRARAVSADARGARCPAEHGWFTFPNGTLAAALFWLLVAAAALGVAVRFRRSSTARAVGAAVRVMAVVIAWAQRDSAGLGARLGPLCTA
jgi:hypothetical protein